MLAYKREKELATEIESDIEIVLAKMESLVEDLDYEDATEEPLSLLSIQFKELRSLKKRARKITSYMSNLVEWNNTKEEIEEDNNTPLSKFKNLEEDRKKGIASIVKILQHCNVLDQVSIRMNHITKEDVEAFCDMYGIEYDGDSHGNWAWINFKKEGKILDLNELRALGVPNYDEYEKKPIKEEPEEEIKEETLDYGWLAPNGVYTESPWGTHEESARKIVDEKGFKEEFKDFEHNDLRLARDFLVYKKGYCLIHNPQGFGITQVTRPDRLTKHQREFLYDYFVKEGSPDRAKFYLELE